MQMIQDAMEEAQKYRPIDNPAILLGEETYKSLYQEARKAQMGSEPVDSAYMPITKFGEMNIYIVDRDSYLNVVEESDIIG